MIVKPRQAFFFTFLLIPL